MRDPALRVVADAADGPIPQSMTLPTSGSPRSRWTGGLRGGRSASVEDTVCSRVDVHTIASGETTEGEVPVLRELHRQRRWRADAHEHRCAGDRRLLDELERQPP